MQAPLPPTRPQGPCPRAPPGTLQPRTLRPQRSCTTSVHGHAGHAGHDALLLPPPQAPAAPGLPRLLRRSRSEECVHTWDLCLMYTSVQGVALGKPPARWVSGLTPRQSGLPSPELPSLSPPGSPVPKSSSPVPQKCLSSRSLRVVIASRTDLAPVRDNEPVELIRQLLRARFVSDDQLQAYATALVLCRHYYMSAHDFLHAVCHSYVEAKGVVAEDSEAALEEARTRAMLLLLLFARNHEESRFSDEELRPLAKVLPRSATIERELSRRLLSCVSPSSAMTLCVSLSAARTLRAHYGWDDREVPTLLRRASKATRKTSSPSPLLRNSRTPSFGEIPPALLNPPSPRSRRRSAPSPPALKQTASPPPTGIQSPQPLSPLSPRTPGVLSGGDEDPLSEGRPRSSMAGTKHAKKFLELKDVLVAEFEEALAAESAAPEGASARERLRARLEATERLTNRCDEETLAIFWRSCEWCRSRPRKFKAHQCFIARQAIDAAVRELLVVRERVIEMGQRLQEADVIRCTSDRKAAFADSDAHFFFVDRDEGIAFPDTLLPPVGVDGLTSFMDVHPQELARQLALIEQGMFLSTPLCEASHLAWMQRSREAKERDAPNLCALIAHSDNVSMWVASEVVLTPNLQQRVATLARFIDLANCCMWCKNLNGMMEVMIGLQNPSVARLASTWSALPRPSLQQFTQLARYSSSDKNYAAYRELLSECEKAQPVLPFVAVSLRDLVFIEEANKTSVTECGRTMYNVDKLIMLSSVFAHFTAAKRVRYRFRPVRPVIDFISQCMRFVPDSKARSSLSLKKQHY
eukprot:m51a1_g3966 hypothetical protein (808) ;mRNA; r:384562-387553